MYSSMVEHPIEVPPTQGSNPGCCIFAHLPSVVNESQADKEADAGEVLAPTSLRGEGGLFLKQS